MKKLLILANMSFSLFVSASEREREEWKYAEEKKANGYIIEARSNKTYIKCRSSKHLKDIKEFNQFDEVSCSLTENGKTRQLHGDEKMDYFIGMNFSLVAQKLKEKGLL